MAVFERLLIILILLLIFASLMACGDTMKGNNKMNLHDKINQHEWTLFSQRRIAFGHQSVGSNILSGIQELAKNDGINLSVTESTNKTGNYTITHFSIGHNENPVSKIQDFETALTSGLAAVSDTAMMKFCYLDIKRGTDVKKLANDYIDSLDRLSHQFPHINFVAVTTPLTTVQSGPKAWIKRMLGKSPSGYIENFHRKEFNEILRNRYSHNGQLFDLAKFEAEGTSKYNYEGVSVEMLNPTFTDDGGHLNEQGRHFIATKFVKYLAAIPHRKI